MDLAHVLLLGAIAGVTILLGMPLGRLSRPVPSLRILLNAVAVGVLLFLLWDVLGQAWEPIDAALVPAGGHGRALGTALAYGALFAGGIAVGLLALVGYDRWMARAAAGGRGGPGAMAISERPARSRGVATWSAPRRLALLIAVGIGLHNFAEGLAIGQSAASGAIGLATLLVIGFALHNATEGFGIVAPLAAENAAGNRPRWRFLLGLAAIGGGPTFVGTAVGQAVTSEPLSVLFLTLAAGSITYVVVQLLGVAGRAKRTDLVCTGVLIGLLAGFLTDAVVTAAGV